MLRFSQPAHQSRSTTVIERHHLPTGTVTQVHSNQPTAMPMPTVVVTAPVLPPLPVFVAPTPVLVTPVVLATAPVAHHSRTVIASGNTVHVAHRPTQHTAHRHRAHSSTLLHSGPTFTPLQGIHKARHHKPKAATIVVSTMQTPNHPTRHVQATVKRKIHK
ncbi:hypothetical protein CC99x_009280 [Candidatus Berkiella cookevillensis]|uniref:Uncharacterized protein n=1 Tax=Candidatus Berkiella cookevillensis TaxID=437022 RepID=A0A0Q9YDU8_9GAMM|nr:hypothetical protein [Candidatus Berkiella cookevillensis]MCS5709095.1 hypothetical protein [Candidatus Berkiella cookevillensis]